MLSQSIKWIKIFDGYNGDRKRWKHISKSANHTWEIRRTGSHPALKEAHSGKRTFIQIYKDGLKFGPSKESVAKAKKAVQDWINEYEGTEWDNS